MAETVWDITAGIPSLGSTGEVVWHICAGIPQAQAAASPSGWSHGVMGVDNADIGDVMGVDIDDIGDVNGVE